MLICLILLLVDNILEINLPEYGPNLLVLKSILITFVLLSNCDVKINKD